MRDLPRGTVTLLFADIEASTRLVTELGERYLPVLEAYRSLVRGEVSRAGGVEIDCKGDEIFLAFSDADGALLTAAAIQRELARPRAALRVRIGIHTGTPGIVTTGRDGYFGLDVHRVARIASAGHGGQVVLSDQTRRQLADESKYALVDLGRHNLRGLPRAEHLFQLVVPGLPTEFPPLRHVEQFAAASNGPRMRVAIGEDSVLLREGIVRLLEEAGFEVVGQAADADGLLREVRRTGPDVAIVDIRMPPSHTDEGIRAACQIRREHERTSVLVLSQHAEPTYAFELLETGPTRVGYLLKDRVSDVLDFAGAVRRVGEGGRALDPEVVALLLRRAGRKLAGLTEIEVEVLELMTEGRTPREIADRLVVDEGVAERHAQAVFDRLGVAPAPGGRRGAALLAALTGADY